MTTRLRSFAKVNLGLAIGRPRADGFHGLATVYQTIGLHDYVTVSAKRAERTSIALECSHPQVPCDERNTAWAMIAGALAAMHIQARVSIRLEKRLPVQGGLGGGSANAVAALLGLERELEIALSAQERLLLAEQIGSDVPLFLIGGTVLGLGRGEQVYPLPDRESGSAEMPCVVALPEVAVSTPQAFRDWDALHTGPSGPAFGLSLVPSPKSSSQQGEKAHGLPAPLTPKGRSATLEGLSRAVAGVWCGPHSSGVSSPEHGMGDLAGNPLLALVRTGIENDFEEVVFPQHPLLGEIKRCLADSVLPDERAVFASLSGSGAALFGLYRSELAAKAAQQRLADRSIAGHLTTTLSRQRYWAEMFLE